VRFAQLLTFSVRHPLLAFGFLAAFTAVLAPQLPQLRRDVRVDKIFPESDPVVEVYERFRAVFGEENQTALCVVELDGDALEADQLARIHRWTEELSVEPLVDSTELTSLSHAVFVRLVGSDELEVGPLYEPRRHETWDRDAIDALLRDNPGFHQRLVSEDRQLAALFVPTCASADDMAERRRFVDRLRAFFGERLRPGERVHLDGLVAAEVELHALIGEDSVRFYGLGFGVLVLALGLTFRRAWLVVAATADVALSVVWTLGFMALVDIPVSFLSAAIPVMIVVACVGDSVYLITRFHQLLAEGRPPGAALHEAVEEVGAACLVTSLTTAASFFALMTSEAEIIRELGLPVGVGVLASYLVSFLLLPPLLARMPAPRSGEVAFGPGLMRAPLSRLGKVVTRRPKSVVAAAALLTLAALAAGQRVQVTQRLMDNLDADQQIMVTRTLLEQRMGGVVPLELLVEADRPGRVLEPDVQAALWELTRRLRSDRFRELGVLYALSLPDFIADMHHTWSERRPGTRTLPASREALCQLKFLYEMADRDPTSDYVDFEERRLRLGMRVANLYTPELLALAEAVRVEAREILPEDVQVELTGKAIMTNAVHKSLVRGVFESLGIAVAVALVLLFVFLRSWRLALLSLVPNLLPLALVLGIMGLVGVPLNISTSIVFTIAFGIAVDDTAHFLAGLRQRRLRLGSSEQAIVETVRETGAALVLTTAILVLGFLVFTASHFHANRHIGALLALTLASALVCDLVVLPALLRVALPSESARRAQEDEEGRM
jgi:predicted RND superfamily exporter protein